MSINDNLFIFSYIYSCMNYTTGLPVYTVAYIVYIALPFYYQVPGTVFCMNKK